MNESDPVGRKRWANSPTLLCIAFVLTVFALVGCGIWLKIRSDDRAAHAEVKKRLAAIRLAGQPLTMADLAKLYPDPPPDRDAVLLLKPALAALIEPTDSTNLPLFGGEWPLDDVPLDKSTLEKIQACIATNQGAFDSVPWEQLKTAWIGSGFQNGISNLTKLPGKISIMLKLLCLDAALEAESQRSTEAAQSIRRAVLIEHTLRDDTILHGIVKFSMDSRICNSLNRVLNRTTMSDSDLMALSDSLIKTNFGTTQELLINERCFGLSMAEMVRSLAARMTNHASFLPARWLRSYQTRFVYRDQDLLNYLDQIEGGLAASDLPLSNAIPRLVASEREEKMKTDDLKKRQRSWFFAVFSRQRISLMSIVAFRATRDVLTRESSTLGYEQVARTAIAIERWRLRHNGNLPDSLSALVPEFLPAIPIDPFDEQQLRYKKLERGYIVYSVGPDLIDDGGKKEPRNPKESEHYDLVFSVAR